MVGLGRAAVLDGGVDRRDGDGIVVMVSWRGLVELPPLTRIRKGMFGLMVKVLLLLGGRQTCALPRSSWK
jgi:hypothetical protein